MNNIITYQRRLIGVEKKLGFLYVPAKARDLLPHENSSIKVWFPGDTKPKHKNYNTDHNRIFGMTPFYKKHHLNAGDVVSVEVSDQGIKVNIQDIEVIEDTDENGKEDFIDTSGLSAQSKGNIGEDRIKEIILLYSQGLLNVYKPVIDERGIDLIVLKEKIYNPVYLQVKTRFNVYKRNRMILNINGNTFKEHHSYYIIGLSFNPTKMEIDEDILFLPSKDVLKLASRLANGDYRITISMANGKTTGKYKKYFVNKEELVNKLIERIDIVNEIVN
ncbi:hypothetical protein [Sinomicrobium weinanense]|uniref:Uncharacterized protein n=1 Tax=Sinomicrobium weinanense TaxID=2842200 RepID=A0A926JPF8_9FLAO|nr:hypothetical protein [Sinomicrobium weinanense]MBC9795062.1 hypothetical protein [Sinomicrobium weinanense]MBU3123809.1 hypothetical protein [Sinomicrobium weinanense]